MFTSLSYTHVGPTLLVVPLFLISLVNLFVAGPPLKTVRGARRQCGLLASLPMADRRADPSRP